MTDKGLSKDVQQRTDTNRLGDFDSLVLERAIFSNVFEKDIRRVYLYKKAERIAKAVHLVLPAFKDAKALKDRLQRLSIEIVDASVLSPLESKEPLSRSLLSLSSVLSMAQAGGMLSPMNAGIIAREVHNLLQEVAGYEDPRVLMPEAPTLAALSKAAPQERVTVPEVRMPVMTQTAAQAVIPIKGHAPPRRQSNGRGESIVSILKDKGPSYIKDISTIIRDVSEKTIQRELQLLIGEGKVKKTGERRWTVYELV